MRIRRSTASSVSLHPPSPVSCSSSSSSSSCFSSSTIHSTISTHSLTSSSNSTSSSTSSCISLSPSRRCEGLDLLVKAVYHVAGSVVGVPYIQKRIIRRRKRAFQFNNLVINSTARDDLDVEEIDEEGEVFDSSSLQEEVNNQRKRSNALPSKYQDSVLQSWKPLNRRRRRRSSKN